MKVSVLIPVYNKAHCIRRCLNSIVYQTYKDLEILVYDDGSTDDSVGEAHSVKDSRIRIIRGKHNAGISRARNALMEAATGEASAWQDADDYSNPYRLEAQIEACRLTGAATSRVYRKYISAISGQLDVFPAPNPLAVNCRRGSFASTLFPSRPVVPFHLGLSLNHELLWLRDMSYLYGNPAVVGAAYYYYSDEEQPFRTMDVSNMENHSRMYWHKRKLWGKFMLWCRVRMAERLDALKPHVSTPKWPVFHGQTHYDVDSVRRFIESEAAR